MGLAQTHASVDEKRIVGSFPRVFGYGVGSGVGELVAVADDEIGESVSGVQLSAGARVGGSRRFFYVVLGYIVEKTTLLRGNGEGDGRRIACKILEGFLYETEIVMLDPLTEKSAWNTDDCTAFIKGNKPGGSQPGFKGLSRNLFLYGP
jgi:hypothetical protein